MLDRKSEFINDKDPLDKSKLHSIRVDSKGKVSLAYHNLHNRNNKHAGKV